jgi:hypothetical protein
VNGGVLRVCRSSRPRRSRRLPSRRRQLTVVSADSGCAVAGARPFARPRPRRKRHVVPRERTAFAVEAAQRRDSSPDVLIVTPDQVFAEYMTHAKAVGTERHIHHLFAGRLVAENGQIKLLREPLNVVVAVQALNPKGAAGLPPPSDEIFSVSHRLPQAGKGMTMTDPSAMRL